MSGVYSVEDLLKLRASPLICKPPNLPPIEEWMGSQEPAAKRPTTRGRQEDTHLHTDGFQKRPTLDPSLRKSTTDPERLVLGPPRRAFASSNPRNLGRTNTNEPEDTQKDGVPRHERTKTGEDLENKFGDRRSGAFGAVNGRFSNRQDQDHERPRRRHDEEDGESRPKRDQDRPRWARDEKGNEETDENGVGKTSFKRDSQARSRFEQSWLRGDRGTEEARRETDRSGWRRDRGKDGDWDLPGKGDVDPEWMDEPETTETAQAHTQEDFQRWKEKMKAAANGPVEEKHDPPATIVATATEAPKSTQAFQATGLVSPDLNVNSMDKFFAKFTEKRNPTEDKGTTIKPASKSKFASLFSPTSAEPKPEPPNVPAMPTPPIVATVPALAPAPAPVSAPVPKAHSPLPSFDNSNLTTEADQAGFKRILEMLGKRDTTPGVDAPKSRPNPIVSEQQSQENRQSPDHLVALFKQSQPSRQTPVSQPPPGLERLVESRSPGEGHRRQETPNELKDEILLNLLRQTNISAKPPQLPQREYEQRPLPGMFASMNEPSRNEPRQMQEDRSDADRQLPMQQRSTARSLFDDSAIAGIPYQDEMSIRQGLQRRPTNGYEDPYFDRIRQQEQQKSMQPPPGMPRPPGLEQMPRMPPGWHGQPPNQHQQPRQGPPPGIMPRGMQPPFGGPQQGPMPPMPQQGQRPPQRKYTGDSGLPNFPPGIGPPPGFMGSGPLPGFHHNNGASQPQNYGRYNMGGEGQGPQQQGPPNMSRAYMEMYGNVERGGLRSGNGGVPLPPGFR